jgi:hypothetical protein
MWSCMLACAEVEANRVDSVSVHDDKVIPKCNLRIGAGFAEWVTKLYAKAEAFEGPSFEECAVPFLEGKVEMIVEEKCIKFHLGSV